MTTRDELEAEYYYIKGFYRAISGCKNEITELLTRRRFGRGPKIEVLPEEYTSERLTYVKERLELFIKSATYDTEQISMQLGELEHLINAQDTP